MSNPNRSKFFIIRAAQAKKVAENTIEIGGNVVAITDANRRFADAVRARRDGEAYEQAAYATLGLAA